MTTKIIREIKKSKSGGKMERADLHLHSCHSKHPAEWFLKRLGTQESYTDIDTIYHSAKERGMSFVTITDHNTIDGALELKEKYPDDTFVSVEVTTYFPETSCKIHLLVYDIDHKQFAQVEFFRANIYKLRDYLHESRIIHSVAHASYSVNDKLDVETVEKLLLLFNTFEGINGARSPYFAKKWIDILNGLTRNDMVLLEEKHGINPFGLTPWKKSITGGSDDHAGLFQARTWTECPETGSYKTFLNAVHTRQSTARGRSHNFKSFAFSIYKIAYDFSRHKAGSDISKGMFETINKMLFEEDGMLSPEAFCGNGVEIFTDRKDKLIHDFVLSLANDLATGDDADLENRVNRIYDNIALLIDNFFVLLMDSVDTSLKKSSPGALLKNIFAALPFFFLSTPFVTSLKHLSKDRTVISGLEKTLGKENTKGNNSVLWFTDTIHDLNGVAVSLRQVAKHAWMSERNLTMVICHSDNALNARLPENVLNLDVVYKLNPEVYSTYTLHFPSLLKSIDKISKLNPEKIVISTPGPVGIVGLIAARILGIECTGIYHTDFKIQTDKILNDATLTSMVLQYDKFFYSHMDEIRSPSLEYINILKERHYPEKKLRFFKRGIDASRFYFNEKKKTDFTIIWSGRISHDKNLSWLIDIYKDMGLAERGVELKIAGDGPAFDYYKTYVDGTSGIELLGESDNDDLPEFYNNGDLFVFPSIMDTFGMVVLEAQACGVPCIVTDKGGPKEIVSIISKANVLSLKDRTFWINTIEAYIDLKASAIDIYSEMKKRISEKTLKHYCWENALADIIGPAVEIEIKEEQAFETIHPEVSGF